MPVDAIGGNVSSTVSGLSQSRLTQDDFIKLFLTELTYQDPLEPINNREFLAQMAQFANLEQTRISNENSNNLVAMNATAQSLGILGRQVEVEGEQGSVIGTVSSIVFSPSGPVITVKKTDGTVVPNIRLSQIKLVRL